MGALILLMADTEGDAQLQITVVATLLGVLTLTWLLLLGAAGVSRLLGVTGLHVVTRVFGVLLTALAVQFMFDGIAGSGLLPT
jgi:multiple antibiotic resistance protein